MIQGGGREGRQVIPSDWVADIWSGGDRAAWTQGDFADKMPQYDMSYRSKWYVRGGGDDLIHCLGIHGQYLFADRRRDLVIAWFSSEHEPTDPSWAAHVFTSVDRIRAAVGFS